MGSTEGRQECVASWLDDQAFFMMVICVLRVPTPHHLWGSVCKSVDTACVFCFVFICL